MHKHHNPGTRITIERISVTTIRRQAGAAKVYCDICRQEIEAAEIKSEPGLLTGNTGAADIEVVATTMDQTKGETK